ncbi:MAG: energy transducer TonB [Ignavibacteriaceae bacterium]|nr:energy transducer TonB [Ignavibacteriaceae bacterium]
MKFLVLFIFICSYNFSQQENPVFIQPIEECFQIIGGLDSLQSRLQYPINAIEHSIEGNVYLLITVDSTGICTNQKIIKSLGFGCDEEAIRLVQTAKFLPAILNGKKINSECMIRIIFRLPKEE